METLAEQGEDSNVIILSLFSLLFACISNIISFYWPEPLRKPHSYFCVSSYFLLKHNKYVIKTQSHQINILK